MKRIILFFTIVFILTAFTFLTSFSASAYDYNGYKYRLKADDTAIISNYIGEETVLVIPSVVDGYTVTEIGAKAFGGCKEVEKIVVPDTVEIIREGAFNYCYGLKEVILSDKIKIIEQDTFCGCSALENIIIPDSVTRIEVWAFYNCTSLKEIVIPDSVTETEHMVFCGCTSLENAVVGNGLEYIERNMFNDCTSLESVTIGEKVRKIMPSAFSGCDNLREIKYTGSEEDFREIEIEVYNDPFEKASVIYDYKPEAASENPETGLEAPDFSMLTLLTAACLMLKRLKAFNAGNL